MAIIARKYNFVGGTTVDPLQVNAELDQLIEAHNSHDISLGTEYYTKVDLQTSGQAQMHWDNLIAKPNFADSSWKPSVATRTDLPLADNVVGDQRVVLNDGDGKQAVYTCVATSGTIDQQWAKIGDVDWLSGEAIREAQESARVTAENNRVSAESGRVSAESGRVSAESGRVSAENTRVNNENSRATSESSRVSAETGRVNAEIGRVNAEGSRVTAENGRVTAENNRRHRGVYNPATTYSVGNEVSYQGSTYRCILASTGNTPTNATYWVLVASAGDMVKAVYDPTNKNQDVFAYVDTHKNNTSNPHQTTASQVGALASVEDDTTPQLGGELDINSHTIGGSLYYNGASGSAKTIDWKKGNHQELLISANCTLTFSAPSKPCMLSLKLEKFGDGGTISFANTIYWQNGEAPEFVLGDESVDFLTLFWDGTRYYGQVASDFKAVI